MSTNLVNRSVFFNSEAGVKQEGNMFPFLISLFLNDLETFFLENNISDLEQISKKCQDTIACYLRIFIILYADDTVILPESAEGLQEALIQLRIIPQMTALS
jgi:hypothetical protein